MSSEDNNDVAEKNASARKSDAKKKTESKAGSKTVVETCFLCPLAGSLRKITLIN